MSDRVLFTIAPYIAALLFVIVTCARTPGERRALLRGDRLDVLALLALLIVGISHAVMWMAPNLLLAWSQSVTRVVAGEVALFVIGVIAALGVARVLVRVLRAGEAIGMADTILVGVLTVAIGSGLALAARYRWASTWSAVTLTPYVRSLITLTPETPLLALPYLVKLHVFSGIALLAVLPFSSVMRPVSVAIHRLRDRLIAPLAAGLTRQSRRVTDWAHESGRALVWPEDED